MPRMAFSRCSAVFVRFVAFAVLCARAYSESPKWVSTLDMPWELTLPFVKQSYDGEMLFVSGVNVTQDISKGLHVNSTCSMGIHVNESTVAWRRCSTSRLELVLSVVGDFVTTCGGLASGFRYLPPKKTKNPNVDFLSESTFFDTMYCNNTSDIVVYNWRTNEEAMRFSLNSSYTSRSVPSKKKWRFSVENLVAIQHSTGRVVVTGQNQKNESNNALLFFRTNAPKRPGVRTSLSLEWAYEDKMDQNNQDQYQQGYQNPCFGTHSVGFAPANPDMYIGGCIVSEDSQHWVMAFVALDVSKKKLLGSWGDELRYITACHFVDSHSNEVECLERAFNSRPTKKLLGHLQVPKSTVLPFTNFEDFFVKSAELSCEGMNAYDLFCSDVTAYAQKSTFVIESWSGVWNIYNDSPYNETSCNVSLASWGNAGYKKELSSGTSLNISSSPRYAGNGWFACKDLPQVALVDADLGIAALSFPNISRVDAFSIHQDGTLLTSFDLSMDNTTQGLRTAPLIGYNAHYVSTAYLQAQIIADLQTLLFWAKDPSNSSVLVAVNMRTSKALWVLPQEVVPGSAFVSAAVQPHMGNGHGRLAVVNNNRVLFYDI